MSDRADIVGFRDGSPIRRHPASTSGLTDEQREALAEALAEHAVCPSMISERDGGYWATFTCGATVPIENSMAEVERAHIADAVAPVVAALLAAEREAGRVEGRAEVLRMAADRVARAALAGEGS